MNDRGIIFFCQCDTIPPDGYCARHGHVTERDRVRRKNDSDAFARLSSLAKRDGWSNIESRLAPVEPPCMELPLDFCADCGRKIQSHEAHGTTAEPCTVRPVQRPAPIGNNSTYIQALERQTQEMKDMPGEHIKVPRPGGAK